MSLNSHEMRTPEYAELKKYRTCVSGLLLLGLGGHRWGRPDSVANA